MLLWIRHLINIGLAICYERVITAFNCSYYDDNSYKDGNSNINNDDADDKDNNDDNDSYDGANDIENNDKSNEITTIITTMAITITIKMIMIMTMTMIITITIMWPKEVDSFNPPMAMHNDILNTLRSRQNGQHFADDIFKCIFLNENVSISIEISLMFVPKGPINNIPAFVQIMAWRRPGDKRQAIIWTNDGSFTDVMRHSASMFLRLLTKVLFSIASLPGVVDTAWWMTGEFERC